MVGSRGVSGGWLPMYVRKRHLALIVQLWHELDEIPAAKNNEALAHCMDRLLQLVGGCNAFWVCATRSPQIDPDDRMNGWRPQDVSVLYESSTRAQKSAATKRRYQRNIVDPHLAGVVRTAGKTRAHLRTDLVDDTTWECSWTYQNVFRPLGLKDRLHGAHTLNPGAESHLVIDRDGHDRPFSIEERDLLYLFVTGAPTFHREQLLHRGILGESKRLAPREQEVLRLLLTDLTEREIAARLNLTPQTTHQYARTLYKTLNVRGRTGLMAKWLRCAGTSGESHDPRLTDFLDQNTSSSGS